MTPAETPSVPADDAAVVYPFAAIVGRDRVKRALIVNAIDPSIGGVLVSGPKGTGKSTLVRAAAAILPEVELVEGCPYRCHPTRVTGMCDACRARRAGGPVPTTTARMRIVQIPIGATEDRVIGSLDIEATLRDGVKGFQPGLLAEANQNVLYIDEVNLLPDHITDDILDAAASGWNVVEREAVSVAHPARFILIGTMNPEEGELRPQILDRFGLHAKAANLADVKQRIEVIQRSDAFIQDPVAFCRKYAPAQAAVRRRIAAARAQLPRVTIGAAELRAIAQVCHRLRVDGYRPDITIAKTARAFAALAGRVEVQTDDVVEAAELALSHRTRQGGTRPPAAPREIRQVLHATVSGPSAPSLRARLSARLAPVRRLRTMPPRQALKSIAFTLLTLLSLFFLTYLCIQVFYVLIDRPTVSPLSYEGLLPAVVATALLFLLTARPRRQKETVRYLDFSKIVTDTDTMRQTVIGEDSDKPVRVSPSIEYTKKIGAVLQTGIKLFRGEASSGDPVPVDDAPREHPRRGQQYLTGKRAKVVTSAHQGRYVWSEPPRAPPWNLAFGPTIRAAAPHQPARRPAGLAIAITPRDFRAKMREYRTPYSIVLLVDMSLSMVNSMINLGRAIFSFHRSVYRRRDRVGLVVFKGSDAFVLQQPTTNLNILTRKLMDVGASDFTPLAAGMLKAWQVLRLEKRRNRDATLLLVIVSDGITNIRLDRALSSHTRRTFLSDAQADVVDVARLLVRAGIRTVVINTSHRPAEMLKRKEEARKVGLQWFTPTEFLMDLAQRTKGSYYGLASGGVTSPRVEATRLDSVFEYDGAVPEGQGNG